MKQSHCKVYIDLGEGWAHWPAGEAEYTAWYEYSPGRPGVHTLRNGDPGFPDDPAELEITELERNGACWTLCNDAGDCILTPEQYESIERQVEDHIMSMQAADDADEADYWRRARSEEE